MARSEQSDWGYASCQWIACIDGVLDYINNDVGPYYLFYYELFKENVDKYVASVEEGIGQGAGFGYVQLPRASQIPEEQYGFVFHEIKYKMESVGYIVNEA